MGEVQSELAQAEKERMRASHRKAEDLQGEADTRAKKGLQESVLIAEVARIHDSAIVEEGKLQGYRRIVG